MAETVRVSGGHHDTVTCGYGRAVTATLTRELPTNWRLNPSPHTIWPTLNWLPDFDALALLATARLSKLHRGGGPPRFLNVNGLLNLVHGQES